jgi:site-specific recombinase XerD
LLKQRRADGTTVWILRYRTNDGASNRVQRQAEIGTVKQYPTESAAQKAADAVRLEINKEVSVAAQQPTMAQLIEHYTKLELPDDDNDTRKSWATKNAYKSYLTNWVEPRWGKCRLTEVKTIAVEDWLRSIPSSKLAEGSKAKIRNVMSALFNHAIRHEWLPMGTNPIKLVRQGSQREQVPEVLEPGEIQVLWSALGVRERAMVSCEYSKGLRVSEAFALRWEDCDFERLTVQVSRGFVKGHLGRLKTEASKKLMPLDPYVAEDLLAWRKASAYPNDQDWVFASDVKKGKQPLWPQNVMVDYIRPAAEQAGTKKHIGWHIFRRSFSTLLNATGGDVKTVQELMRHASIKTTMNTYTQAVPDHVRAAQSKVVEMIRQAPVTVDASRPQSAGA